MRIAFKRTKRTNSNRRLPELHKKIQIASRLKKLASMEHNSVKPLGSKTA